MHNIYVNHSVTYMTYEFPLVWNSSHPRQGNNNPLKYFDLNWLHVFLVLTPIVVAVTGIIPMWPGFRKNDATNVGPNVGTLGLLASNLLRMVSGSLIGMFMEGICLFGSYDFDFFPYLPSKGPTFLYWLSGDTGEALWSREVHTHTCTEGTSCFKSHLWVLTWLWMNWWFLGRRTSRVPSIHGCVMHRSHHHSLSPSNKWPWMLDVICIQAGRQIWGVKHATCLYCILFTRFLDMLLCWQHSQGSWPTSEFNFYASAFVGILLLSLAEERLDHLAHSFPAEIGSMPFQLLYPDQPLWLVCWMTRSHKVF